MAGVDVEEPEQAERMVRELEERDVETAKGPDGETVLVSVEEPKGVLEPFGGGGGLAEDGVRDVAPATETCDRVWSTTVKE